MRLDDPRRRFSKTLMKQAEKGATQKLKTALKEAAKVAKIVTIGK